MRTVHKKINAYVAHYFDAAAKHVTQQEVTAINGIKGATHGKYHIALWLSPVSDHINLRRQTTTAITAA